MAISLHTVSLLIVDSIRHPPYDRIHMVDHTTVFTYRIALSLMWKDPYWGVCEYMCVCVCMAATTRVPTQANKRGCSYPHFQLHTGNTSAVCVCVCTPSHIFITFVCDCLTVFACVHTVCVCVRVCIPRKALGLQAAWWQCRWDNIWHVSDWVSVCMHVCVCVCLCVCVSVHLGSPLIGRGSLCSPWPTGEPAGRQKEREGARAARPAYLQPLSPPPTLLLQ